MPKYRGKTWTKKGRGAQSPEQLKKFGALLAENDAEATATLMETGKPLIVHFEGDAKAYRIAVDGTHRMVAPPKGKSSEVSA